ncbi:MAG: DUF1398 family protein [Candidatus Woesearchaeota archaeon]|nr:DUF1398 family protein [Candidatus Woesearchaeota archaeon]
MSKAIDNLKTAQQKAMDKRPKIGGFPYMAETLRQAGVTRNIWFLPSCQSLFITKEGPVMFQDTPLTIGMMDVPKFDREVLIAALRADQSGKTTFREFLFASWSAGVIRYDVNFIERTVTYYGWNDENYVEAYPHVHLD